MNNKTFTKTVAVVSACVVITFFSGCKNQKARTFFTMDTVCKITVYDGNEKALDKAVTLCQNLGNILNSKSDDSEIAVLNKNRIIKNASDDTLYVLEKALYYCKISDGAFDITMGNVTSLWDFKGNALPQNQKLSKAVETVDYKNIVLDKARKTVTLSGNGTVDLGAVAKGYIADKVRESLLNDNVKSAIINLGGNVVTVGKNGKNNFSVGIETPFESSISAAVSENDMAVVTSGTYQRYIQKDGIIYHHLLNSKTGMSEQNSLDSVTVIAKNSTDADALSTVCFLLGQEKATNLIDSIKNTYAVFIDKNKSLYLTKGLKIDSDKEITIE